MPYELRTIVAEEAESWMACIDTAFFHRPPPERGTAWVAHVDLGRRWAAFDGDRVVGTLASFPSEVTVPGPRSVQATAITAATVMPTHRRRGVLSSMITAELRAAVERHEAVSVLVAAEWPIYGRFGYGPSAEAADYEVDSRSARFLHPARGSVELVDDETMLSVAPGVHDRLRVALPGAVERTRYWWERHVGSLADPQPGSPPSFNALYHGPGGELEGFLRYRAELDWRAATPASRVHVDDLIAVTPAAYHGLWRYTCEIDLVTEVLARWRPTDEALPYLLENGRSVRRAERYDMIWARLLDVPVALEARRYFATGSLVLSLSDPLGIAGGTYRLDAGTGGVSCAPSGEAPQLSLDMGTLGALYLGGASVHRLAEAGRVEEHVPGSLDLAAALFQAPTPPWCPTFF